MSIHEIEAKARELKELKIMAEELATEIGTIEGEIKIAMGDQEQVLAGPYKITWSPVTSSRIDTSALRKALPDVADRFLRTTTSRRFCIL